MLGGNRDSVGAAARSPPVTFTAQAQLFAVDRRIAPREVFSLTFHAGSRAMPDLKTLGVAAGLFAFWSGLATGEEAAPPKHEPQPHQAQECACPQFRTTGFGDTLCLWVKVSTKYDAMGTPYYGYIGMLCGSIWIVGYETYYNHGDSPAGDCFNPDHTPPPPSDPIKCFTIPTTTTTAAAISRNEQQDAPAEKDVPKFVFRCQPELAENGLKHESHFAPSFSHPEDKAGELTVSFTDGGVRKYAQVHLLHVRPRKFVDPDTGMVRTLPETPVSFGLGYEDRKLRQADVEITTVTTTGPCVREFNVGTIPCQVILHKSE